MKTWKKRKKPLLLTLLLSKSGRRKKPPKPVCSRVMIEAAQLEKAFERFVCLKCNGGLDVTMRNLCLATSFSIGCKDEACDFIVHSEAPAPPDWLGMTSMYCARVFICHSQRTLWSAGTSTATSPRRQTLLTFGPTIVVLGLVQPQRRRTIG
jgi:hypothetical protein